jgi:hypothetical protein
LPFAGSVPDLLWNTIWPSKSIECTDTKFMWLVIVLKSRGV